MAKFTFPMSFDQFKKAVKDEKAFDVLGAVGELEYAYSCLRAGWMNKMHHKETQERMRDEQRAIRKMLAEDPELRKKFNARSRETL